jgi:hypothetical protein
MAQDIKLRLINESNDRNNSQILIFQKNDALGDYGAVVAWQAIQNLGQGSRHPLLYSPTVFVDAEDSYGNYTAQQGPAKPGAAYEMIKNTSGDVLQAYAPGATVSTEIQVFNHLQSGSITANIYRSGSLVSQKSGIVPGQKAVFAFQPTIFIGAVSQVEQGAVLNPAIVSSINTELSLIGIASADIVMRGGGPGSQATPFTFTFENIVLA